MPMWMQRLLAPLVCQTLSLSLSLSLYPSLSLSLCLSERAPFNHRHSVLILLDVAVVTKALSFTGSNLVDFEGSTQVTFQSGIVRVARVAHDSAPL